MSDTQPGQRSAGAIEIAGAVRRAARVARSGQARIAHVLFDRYGWEAGRIAEELDITTAAATHLLAADGVIRCVDCSFDVHHSCMGAMSTDAYGVSKPCECEHDAARSGNEKPEARHEH